MGHLNNKNGSSDSSDNTCLICGCSTHQLGLTFLFESDYYCSKDCLKIGQIRAKRQKVLQRNLERKRQLIELMEKEESLPACYSCQTPLDSTNVLVTHNGLKYCSLRCQNSARRNIEVAKAQFLRYSLKECSDGGLSEDEARRCRKSQEVLEHYHEPMPDLDAVLNPRLLDDVGERTRHFYAAAGRVMPW